ncbi:MAG: DUF493 domain-containing protein [Pseudomonadota bacterium]
MTDIEAPKIEFPCRYPIKTIGDQREHFERDVIACVERHAGQLAAADITTRPSRNQRFCAITCVIEATGEPQLKALHEDLLAVEGVRMVL